MRAARQELTLHERKPAFCFQRPVECDGGLCAGLRLFGDVDAVFLCILEKISLQPALGGLRRAVDDAEIAFFDLTVFDLLIEDAKRLRIFRRDDDAAGVAVDAVAERGRERILLARPPFALGIEIGLNVIDQRFAVFRAVMRVNGLAGLLVGKENVLILVDDVELRDADGQIGVFLLWGVKKLVVDIKLDDISGGKMGIALGALSVQLDALETDVFLHQ